MPKLIARRQLAGLISSLLVRSHANFPKIYNNWPVTSTEHGRFRFSLAVTS